MRYIASSSREAYEADLLPREFGKTFAPSGAVTLRGDARLRTDGLQLIPLEGRTLAMVADTASWAFLDPEEVALLSRADGKAADSVIAAAGDAGRADRFLRAAFRRGLLTIDGVYATDPTMFDDSSNLPDDHLVELLLTEKCNLGCVYCLAGANPKMPAMTAEHARRTVDLAFATRPMQSLTFEFSGGEPFLRFPLMRELVAYIRAHPLHGTRPVHIVTQTNCTLLNEERVRWLRENDVQVGISLDGNPASHNQSRPQVNGGESFPQLIHGIDLLQRHSIPFGALVVLNRHNVGSAHELVDFLIDNGITGFKLNTVAYLGTARHTWDDIGITDQEAISYFIELLELIAERRLPLVESNTRSMCEFLIAKQRPTRCMRSHCGAGDTFQAIAANGDIYPCGRATQTPALKMGNVGDATLTDLTTPALHHAVVSEIRTRRPRDLEGCTTCAYRQLCQAGCSAQAFERYGTVRHRTPECTFYKTMYPHLMRWLTHDEPAFAFLNALQYFGTDASLVDTHA